MFFALSLKRSGDCLAPSAIADRFGAVKCRIRCVFSCSARRASLPLHPGCKPVRRLRSSINIVTFPGRSVRTVSRFNRFAPNAGPAGGCGAAISGAPQGG
jgi:hypothetical protein